MANKATVIALIGELGAGKTTFVQKFARACGITEPVLSPTFVILKNYQLPITNYRFIHIDAYRLKNSQELINLGINDLIADPNNVILIEWADRVSDILPDDCITIRFDHVNESTRK